MPRRTNSNDPEDWLWMAENDLSVIRLALAPEIGFTTCRGKLAEVLDPTARADWFAAKGGLSGLHRLPRACCPGR